MTIKVIAGLANPGDKYIFTRHNVGSWFVYLLAKSKSKFLKKENNFFGYTTEITINNNIVYLLIPNTFINMSGKSIKALTTFYNIKPEEILVVHDDLNVLPGNIKLKFGGSSGGHNGLKNISSYLNNNSNYYRLRIGIGHPGNKDEVLDFVLTKPSITEKHLIDLAINKAVSFTDNFILQDAFKRKSKTFVSKINLY